MDSHPVEDSVPTQQLESVLREVSALKSAMKRARTVRLLVFLVLVIGVATIAVIMKIKLDQLTSEQYLNRLAEVANRRLEQKKDFYSKQLELLVDKVGPPLSKAFLDQTKKDMPLYFKALEKERQPFLDNFQAKFSERIVKRYENMQPRYESILQQEFPQWKDKQTRDRMAANIDRAVDKLLQKYYVEDLAKEINTLYATWDQFPPAGPPQKDDMPAEDQLIDGLLKLLAHRLTHSKGTLK